jgi:hypothetical protein
MGALSGRAPRQRSHVCHFAGKSNAASTTVSAEATILSNSFWPGAMASISLLTGSPLTIMFSAFSTPITRGSRCVPPAPGIRPSFTSGSATLVPGAATR